MDINTAIKENPNAPLTRTLTVHDRCDSCGAQALVRFEVFGSVLDFCGHHASKNASALEVQGAGITHDDREVLLVEESGLRG